MIAEQSASASQIIQSYDELVTTGISNYINGFVAEVNS